MKHSTFNTQRSTLKWILLLVTCHMSAGAAITNFFDLADFTDVSLAGRKVTITPLSAPFQRGGHLISRDKKTYTSNGSGLFTITNQLPGDYEGTILAPPSTTLFYFTVPETNGYFNVTNWLVPTVTAPGTLAYTRTESDARYVRGVGAGTNIVNTTNSTTGVITVNLKPAVPAAYISSGIVDNDEFDRIDGLTANAQTQINGKQLGSFNLTNFSVHATNQFLSTNILTTAGDVPYFTGAAWARRAIGTAGQLLTVSGGVPVWSSHAAVQTPWASDINGANLALTNLGALSVDIPVTIRNGSVDIMRFDYTGEEADFRFGPTNVLASGVSVDLGSTNDPWYSGYFSQLVQSSLVKITGGSPGAGKVLTATDGTGAATWQPPSGLVGVTNQNVLYVAKNGSDATGARNRLDLPFLTIGQAKTNALAGDLIYVFPGTYNETDLATNKVNYFFLGDVTYTGASTRAIFDDHLGPLNITIAGRGSFTNNAAAVVTSAFLITNPLSRVVAHGINVSATANNDSSAVVISNCAFVEFTFSLYEGAASGGNGIKWYDGDCHFHGAKAIGNYGLWASSPAADTAANLYSDISIYEGGLNGIAQVGQHLTNTNYRLWITKAAEITSLNSAAALSTGGRSYVQVEKIKTGGASAVLVNGGTLWLDAQKITAGAGGRFIEIEGDAPCSVIARVMDYEDLGVEVGAQVTLGNLDLSGGTMTLTNVGAVGVNYATDAGRVRLRDMVIDTQATGGAAVKASGSANPLILQNCTLVASNTVFSITTDDSATVKNYYSVANRTTNGAVTVQVVPLTVDVNVK